LIYASPAFLSYAPYSSGAVIAAWEIAAFASGKRRFLLGSALFPENLGPSQQKEGCRSSPSFRQMSDFKVLAQISFRRGAPLRGGSGP
jgi:hypothetical protein